MPPRAVFVSLPPSAARVLMRIAAENDVKPRDVARAILLANLAEVARQSAAHPRPEDNDRPDSPGGVAAPAIPRPAGDRP